MRQVKVKAIRRQQAACNHTVGRIMSGPKVDPKGVVYRHARCADCDAHIHVEVTR